MKKTLLFSASLVVMLTVDSGLVNAADVPAADISSSIQINDGDNITGTQNFTGDHLLTIGEGAGTVTVDEALTGNLITTNTDGEGNINLVSGSVLEQSDFDIGESGTSIGDVLIGGTLTSGTGSLYAENVDVSGSYTSTGGNVSIDTLDVLGSVNVSSTDVSMSGDMDLNGTYTSNGGSLTTNNLNFAGSIDLTSTEVTTTGDIVIDGNSTLDLDNNSSIGDITVNDGFTLTLGDVSSNSTLGAIDAANAKQSSISVSGDATLDNGMGLVNRFDTITIENGAALNTTGQSITADNIEVEGSLTSTGGTITANEGQGTYGFRVNGGDLDLTDTIVTTDAAISMDGTSSAVLSGSTSISNGFNVITGTTTLSLSDTASSGDIEIYNNAELILGDVVAGATLGTIEGFSDGDGTLTIDGDVTLDANIGENHYLDTVAINSGNTLDVNGKDIYSDNIDVNGSLLSTGGSLNIEGGYLSVAGSVDLTDTNITGTSAVLVDGASSVTLSGASDVESGFVIMSDTAMLVEDTASTGDIYVDSGDLLTLTAQSTATIGAINGLAEGDGDLSLAGDLVLSDDMGAEYKLNDVNVASGATLTATDVNIATTTLDVDGSVVANGGDLEVTYISGTMDLTDVDIASVEMPTDTEEEIVGDAVVIDDVSNIILSGSSRFATGVSVEADATLTLEDTSNTGDITISSLGTLRVVGLDDTATLGVIDGAADNNGTLVVAGDLDLQNNVGDTHALATIDIDGAFDISDKSISAQNIDIDGGLTANGGTISVSNSFALAGNLDLTDTVLSGDVDVDGDSVITLSSSSALSNSLNITAGSSSLTMDETSSVGSVQLTTGAALDLAGTNGATVGAIDGDGSLNFSGNMSLSNDIGSSTALNTVSSSAGELISDGFDISSTALNVNGGDITLSNMILDVQDGNSGTTDVDLSSGNLSLTDVTLNVDHAVSLSGGGLSLAGSTSLSEGISISADSYLELEDTSSSGNIVIGDAVLDIRALDDTSTIGTIEGSAADTGTLRLSGDFVLDASVGATNRLNRIEMSEITTNLDFGQTVSAKTLAFINNSTLNVDTDTPTLTGYDDVILDGGVINLNNENLVVDSDLTISNASRIDVGVSSDTDYGTATVTGDLSMSEDTVINLSLDSDYQDSLVEGQEYTIFNISGDDSGVATLLDGNITDNTSLFKWVQKANPATGEVTLVSEIEVHFDDITEDGYADGIGAAIQNDVENAGLSTELRGIINNVGDLASGEQENAIKKLSPEASGASISATLGAQRQVSTTVQNRLTILGLASGDDGMRQAYGIWGDAIIAAGEQDAKDGFDGYETNSYGFSFGFDTAISDNSELGVAVSYTGTSVDGTDNSSGNSTDIDTITLTGYGAHDFYNYPWTFEGQVSMAMSSYDSSRDLTSLGAGTAKGNFDGTTYGLRGGFTTELKGARGVLFTPYIGAGYYHTSIDGYTETGSAAALTVEGQDYDSFSSTLGLEAEYARGSYNANWDVTNAVHAYWNHEFITDTYDNIAKFVGGDTTFTTTGLEPDADTFTFGFKSHLSSNRDQTLNLSWDVDFRDSYLGYRGKAEYRQEF